MKSQNKKESTEWKKLDNASKIFPATANNKDTKVYRIAAELKADVHPGDLQKALNITLESFPMYRSVLRRGFFWYYFELTNIAPQVEEESTSPCSPLYIEGQRNLLFKVSYYKKRINFELFHALSDGAGALWFLETLIYHYMTIHYKNHLPKDLPGLEHRASISQKMDDSFWKNYSSSIKAAKIQKDTYQKAYRIKGKRIDENRMRVIEGAMSVKELLKVAKDYGASMTVFLTALLIYSIYQEMPQNKRKKPVVISVPINLRGYYNSSTARNFFTTMDISYDFATMSAEFEDIVAYVGQEFKEGLKEENIDSKLARFMKIEKNPAARIVPLTIKDIFMKLANEVNSMGLTSSISNVGRIQTAEEFEPYIEQFSLCISARVPKVTLCSYGDKLVITFTSPYMEADIQREFFQFLSKRQIRIQITSNI